MTSPSRVWNFIKLQLFHRVRAQKIVKLHNCNATYDQDVIKLEIGFHAQRERVKKLETAVLHIQVSRSISFLQYKKWALTWTQLQGHVMATKLSGRRTTYPYRCYECWPNCRHGVLHIHLLRINERTESPNLGSDTSVPTNCRPHIGPNVPPMRPELYLFTFLIRIANRLESQQNALPRIAESRDVHRSPLYSAPPRMVSHLACCCRQSSFM